MAINPLPKNFRDRYGTSSIASYNFDDLINGNGIVKFYARTGSASTGTSDFLSTEAGFQGQVYTFGQTSSTNYTNVCSKRFYLSPFTIPQTIGGLMSIESVMLLGRTATGSSPGNSYLQINVYKNNTIIATQDTGVFGPSTGGWGNIVDNMLIPRTEFPIGSQLSIEVVCYLKETGANSGDPIAGFMWSSMNETKAITDLGYYDFTVTPDANTGSFSYTRFGVPFKIEL